METGRDGAVDEGRDGDGCGQWKRAVDAGRDLGSGCRQGKQAGMRGVDAGMDGAGMWAGMGQWMQAVEVSRDLGRDADRDLGSGGGQEGRQWK